MEPSPRVIAVIGQGVSSPETDRNAHEVGRRLAEAGCVVVTGGLGGVMTAASRGAREAGGLVVGIVPGPSREEANPWVTVAVATGMGDARNAILANTADAFVAVGGSHGTLSEIAFALKRGKRVVSLGSWQVDPAVTAAESAEEAVRQVLA
ncbi:MAG: TIGR00725 family protein [Myxococcota bacterium]